MLRSKTYRVVSSTDETVVHENKRLDHAMWWARKDPEARRRLTSGDSLTVLRVSTSVVHEVRRHS